MSSQVQSLEDGLRKAETNKVIAEAILNDLRLAGGTVPPTLLTLLMLN